jgi:Na+-transporting methylmalonyl-CoA/oxaloacetate decarboxylase gamma subunit
MPWIDRLGVGLQLTAVGMGLVFLLLALLWCVLTLLLRLDRTEPAPASSEGGRVAAVPPAVPATMLAAIGVAVLIHRAICRKQAAPMMRTHMPGSLLYASRWVAGGRHIQNQAWHPRSR